MAFAGSLALPETLKDPVRGPSHDPHRAAWTAAIGTDLSFFEWMHQQVPISQAAARTTARLAGSDPAGDAEESSHEKLVPRTDTELYNLGLAGYSRSRGRALLYDFPWEEVGDGLIVDVGGGVGEFSRAN